MAACETDSLKEHGSVIYPFAGLFPILRHKCRQNPLHIRHLPCKSQTGQSFLCPTAYRGNTHGHLSKPVILGQQHGDRQIICISGQLTQMRLKNIPAAISDTVFILGLKT